MDGVSEVEPTVVAALALDDARARAWLETRQRADGGFDELDGRVDGPTTAALAALALDDRSARSVLSRYAIRERGLPLPNAADPNAASAGAGPSDTRSLDGADRPCAPRRERA